MPFQPRKSDRVRNLKKVLHVFPADIERNKIYFMINIREYKPVTNLAAAFSEKGSSVTAGEITINKAYYILPVPQQGLNEVFNLNYRNLDMQATGGVAETIQQFTKGDFTKGLEGVGGAAEFLFKKAAESGSSALLGLFGSRPDQAEGILELATGIADNPNLALLFKGVELRNHTFSWKFMPRNKQESDMIKDLTRSLVASALPTTPVLSKSNNFLLGYPDVAYFKIWGPTKDLITINKNGSFITNVKLSYSDGEVAFFKDTYEPAEVTLTIALTERNIITRKDYEGKAVDLLQNEFTG